MEFRGGRIGGRVVMATLSCRITLTAAGVIKGGGETGDQLNSLGVWGKVEQCRGLRAIGAI